MRTLAMVGLLVMGFASNADAGRPGGRGGSHSSGGHSTTSKSPASHASSGASGTGASSSSHVVRGYTTKRGTYVAPHRQTNADHTQRNNYSTKGNVNPSTGKTGTKSATH
jgi:hypothetical protein